MARPLPIFLAVGGFWALTAPVALATPLPDDGVAQSDDEAEEDDDDFGGDDIDLDVFREAEPDDDATEVRRMDEGDTLDEGDAQEPADEDYGGDIEDEGFDFDDDEEEVPIGGPGQDTARIYRDYMDSLEDLGPDEEIIAWERYIQKYPHTLFRDRITARIDSLTEFQYDERVPGSHGWDDSVDAGMRELAFAPLLHLDTIDPRDRLRVGFEWGFPQWINLVADLEHQIQRNWSVHGGILNRYTGWNIEAGTRYALVKSARTRTLVTGIFDIHMNTRPIFPGLRPQVGVGKQLTVGGGVLDLQAQAGVDLELRTETPMAMRWIGGANVTYHASERVNFFFETSIQAKDLLWDDGASFRFPLATFGVSFNLDEAGKKLATIGANAPYANSYWGYHFGSVMGDFNYYY